MIVTLHFILALQMHATSIIPRTNPVYKYGEFAIIKGVFGTAVAEGAPASNVDHYQSGKSTRSSALVKAWSLDQRPC